MIIEELKRRWWKKVVKNDLENSEVTVKVRGLNPEEAIGKPAEKDFPPVQRARSDGSSRV